MNIVTTLGKWFRRCQKMPSSFIGDRIEYSVSEGSTQFTVYAMRHGVQVGFCVAAAYEARDCCFVYDVVVFKEQDRRKGVGSELVRQAWVHSKRATVIPVDVVVEAAVWWAKRATKGPVLIQIGLSKSDELMVRYASERPGPLAPMHLPLTEAS